MSIDGLFPGSTHPLELGRESNRDLFAGSPGSIIGQGVREP